MASVLDGLNDAQLAAVTSTSDVLQILAPPGSGKTKTLTSRVAYLIQHYGYRPWNILCLTFTIKSSREMKERLARLIGNGMEKKLILGTFHSVCRRYLVAYGHLIGICKSFGIADSSDSLSIIKRIIKRLGLQIEPKVAQSRISSSKSKGIGPSEIAAEVAKKSKVDQQEFSQIFEAYESQLEKSNLLDYDDLLLRCVDLLRRYPSCVSNVEAVLIDEFQDTNIIQFDLMKLFAAERKRITTVGDPDQSIYGWRSAEVENLKKMQKQFSDTLIIHLEDNYRSSGAILLAAQEVIEQDDSRPPKRLQPTHCPGTVPVLRRLPTSETEASWIVTEILRIMGMTGNIFELADFAILLRSAALSRQIELAMGKAGIPYRMVGGQRFFDRIEIRILLDYLRAISQPNNNDAVARVINIPARGVGATTVKSLLEEAEVKKTTFWSLIFGFTRGHFRTTTKINKPAEQGLGTFVNIILTSQNKLANPIDPLSPRLLLELIMERLKFQEYIKKTYEIDHDNRWANVEELLSQASEYPIPLPDADATVETDEGLLPSVEGVDQLNGGIGEDKLSEFLANVALATELQKDEDVEGQSSSQVTVSTIHAAKGLEWPVVFVPSAYEGSIPHSRAEDTDEERRLLYVAMTRAQALLYVSCPVKNSQREEATLSQFLSSKKVNHYFVKAGPKLGLTAVSDIARILRRDCPSEKEILKGSSTMQNREDNLWPLDGSEDVEQLKSNWDTWKSTSVNRTVGNNGISSNRGSYKSVTATSISIGTTTTMQNAPSFSVTNFGGFTSATAQLEQLSESGTACGSKRGLPAETRPCAAVSSKLEKGVRKRKTKHEPQGNLMSLWSSKAQSKDPGQPLEYPEPTLMRASQYHEICTATSPLPLPATHYLPPARTATPSLSRSVASVHNLPLSKPRPLAVVPSNLANHRLKPATKLYRPQLPATEPSCPGKRNHYVFLSSSPPPPEPETQSTMTNNVQDDAEKETSDVCPAATFHTTSMAQVQNPRKTLGVRRSMNGWNQRGTATTAQGFSVPRKVQR